MTRRTWIGPALAASLVVAACGYPTFTYGPGAGGSGGESSSSSSSGTGGASSSSSSGTGGASSSSSSGTGGASSSSSSSSSSSTGGPTCAIDHLLISEVRSRGAAGATDDFIELYNPTDQPIQLDSAWVINAIKVELGSILYTKRWVGNGSTVVPHGHYLIAASGYTQSPSPDDVLSPSLTDAAAIHLEHGPTIVDKLCYYKDFNSSVTVLGYNCEGGAVLNPHDDTDNTNTDQSLERRPGGNFGHCVDTDDNAADFIIQIPATPKNSSTPPQPP